MARCVSVQLCPRFRFLSQGVVRSDSGASEFVQGAGVLLKSGLDVSSEVGGLLAVAHCPARLMSSAEAQSFGTCPLLRESRAALNTFARPS